MKNPQSELYSLIEAGLKSLESSPPEEQVAFLQRVGILTADRKLAVRYGGRGKGTKLREAKVFSAV